MIYVCENDKHAGAVKIQRVTFLLPRYVRSQLRSYVICNRIVVAIFVRATPYTGERRSFDQLETSNTIPLLNASADMPRQAHTCADRAVVSKTRTLRLQHLFRLYENLAFFETNYIFIIFIFIIMLCKIFLFLVVSIAMRKTFKYVPKIAGGFANQYQTG